jgi:hypothetical protein
MRLIIHQDYYNDAMGVRGFNSDQYQELLRGIYHNYVIGEFGEDIKLDDWDLNRGTGYHCYNLMSHYFWKGYSDKFGVFWAE